MLLLPTGNTDERDTHIEPEMPQTEQQKIRSRLRSYERKLQQEKKKFGYRRG